MKTGKFSDRDWEGLATDDREIGRREAPIGAGVEILYTYTRARFFHK
jgi:hypothetical protein